MNLFDISILFLIYRIWYFSIILIYFQTIPQTRLESEVSELKGEVSTLKHDLVNSEAVQRDFVRLSQSLQVQLEKIRQSEKEVRWQYEEDVDDCTSCHQRFTGVGRRKVSCIFKVNQTLMAI